MIIPEGVVIIGNRTFNWCGKLTSVTIPASIASIGEYAFENSALTSVAIPNATIGNWAFSECKDLQDVTLGNGVTAIGHNAFRSTGITSIRIPSTVKTIGGSAFILCRSLTSVELPEGLSEISEQLFVGCTALASIALPEGLKIIRGGAFNDCSALREITLPATLETIVGNSGDYNTLGNCTSLTTVNIPENSALKTIERRAFFGTPLNLATQARLRNFGYTHE